MNTTTTTPVLPEVSLAATLTRAARAYADMAGRVEGVGAALHTRVAVTWETGTARITVDDTGAAARTAARMGLPYQPQASRPDTPSTDGHHVWAGTVHDVPVIIESHGRLDGRRAALAAHRRDRDLLTALTRGVHA